MKLHRLSLLLCIYVTINLVNATTQLKSPAGNDLCPLWHFFNTTTNLCECTTTSGLNDVIKCTEHGIELRVGHCMTYNESEERFDIAHCNYFDGNFSTRLSDNGRYVELSVNNVSELNNVMCDPMNRTGRLCSECIEGYGPSIISLGLVCIKCTNVTMWYGVPLYLFLEFVPITVFYVIILLLRVNITSAPMVAFVFYSQLIVSTFLNHGPDIKFANYTAFYFVHVYVMFYGFWNLDFFHYILPPFCVSSKLKNIHIIFIGYVSAFYPLCLICITWMIVKLHYYNFKPVVWLWSKIRKCSFVHIIQDHHLNRSNSLIDAFTTFFLLSFSKLVYTSAKILTPLKAVVYMNNTTSHNHRLAEDPRIDYFRSNEHLIYALISIFIVLLMILPPVVLLSLYPIKAFRLLLFKCRFSTRTLASLNIFVEKYYSCYRDGTDGGKDMRSLASMYFILRVINILLFQMISLSSSLISAVVLYTSYGITIALVRPYKKTYMNVIDTLIVANLALLALTLDKLYLEDSNTSLALLYASVIGIFSVLPLLGLTGCIAYRILRRIVTELDLFRTKMASKKLSNKTAPMAQQDLNDDPELPDRVLHPQQYNFVRMKHFANVNYVSAP